MYGYAVLPIPSSACCHHVTVSIDAASGSPQLQHSTLILRFLGSVHVYVTVTIDAASGSPQLQHSTLILRFLGSVHV